MLGSGEVRGSSILLGLKIIHAMAAMAKEKGSGLPVTLLTIYKQGKSKSGQWKYQSFGKLHRGIIISTIILVVLLMVFRWCRFRYENHV